MRQHFILRHAKEFPTEDARKEHLKEHPGADPKNHTVSDGGGKGGDNEGGSSGGPDVSGLKNAPKKFRKRLDALATAIESGGLTPANVKKVERASDALGAEIAEKRMRAEELAQFHKERPESGWDKSLERVKQSIEGLQTLDKSLDNLLDAAQASKDKAKADKTKAKADKADSAAKAKADAKAKKEQDKADKAEGKADSAADAAGQGTPAQQKANKAIHKKFDRFKRDLPGGNDLSQLLGDKDKAHPERAAEVTKYLQDNAKLYGNAAKNPPKGKEKFAQGWKAQAALFKGALQLAEGKEVDVDTEGLTDFQKGQVDYMRDAVAGRKKREKAKARKLEREKAKTASWDTAFWED